METSSLSSTSSNQNVGVSVMKKAIKLQEDQMQTLLQSSSADSAQIEASSAKTASSAHTGVGSKLNLLG